MDWQKRREIEEQAIASLWRDDGPDANPYEEGTEEYGVWLGAWTDAFDAANPDR